MKICLTGTISTGKTTLVNDFLKQWPTYKLGTNSYKKILKEKKLPHSTQGTEESQQIILEAIIDDITKEKKEENIIYDRGLLDNLAYTIYLNEKGVISDEYVKTTIPIIREALSFYDIIFYIPLLERYPVELVDDGNRDANPVFREETDNILKEIYRNYISKDKRVFFPNRDCPAVIELFGTRQERIEMIKLYIKDDGTSFREEESLLVDVNNQPLKLHK